MRESMPSIPYRKALEEIYSLDKLGSHLGLERITKMLELLGSPEKKYRCVVVAGSNGKGSTVVMLGSILQKNGWKTGTYFSPQIEEFAERIRINGRNASEGELAKAYLQVKQICKEHSIQATFFEVVTAMALLVFARQKVDAAVLEVGLGGRLDATNAEVSCIASICLEHTGILGDSEEKIVREKCGIARAGRPLVVGQVNGAVRRAIEAECSHSGANPVFISDEVKISGISQKGGKYSFNASFRGTEYSLSLAAPGKFQVSNACVALAAAKIFGAGKKAIEEGLRAAVPKYRMQKMSSSPPIIADCCHNPGAAFALAHELRQIQGPKVLLFSAMKDKDYPKVLSILAPFFELAILTRVSLKRAAALKDLQDAAAKAGIRAIPIEKPSSALAAAKKLSRKKATLFIAGSIYLLGELYGKGKIKVAQ